MPSIIYLPSAADDDAYLGWGSSKIWFLVQKSWFFINSKHFREKIMTPCYSCCFCNFNIFNFFQIIMVSLFLGIWKSRVKKPSYGLWRHKAELSQIVTLKLIFLNSEFFMKIKFPSYVTRKFYLCLITLKFPSYATREFKFH